MSKSSKKKRKSQKARKQRPPGKDFGQIVLGLMAFIVAGSLYLATVDPESRRIFEDLAKIALGGLIGWLMPRG